jgi:hypothetical protein
LNSQSTPAAAVTQQGEPNLQNVNPNVIHSSHGGQATASSNTSSSSTHLSSPPPSLPPPPTTSSAAANSASNSKSQVITQNIHAKTTSGGGVNMKDDRQQPVVEAMSTLSANTVPGVQLPTNSSNNTSNSPSVSTIVNTNQVQMQTTSPTMSVSVSSSSIASHGSLYQHLTNNQTGNQRERASPLVQGVHQGRASPITPTTSSLVNDGHSNHTSVLQNMNSSAGVISSAGFHGTNTTQEPNPAMLKAQYEKQSRIHALQQQEETGRRSRYVECFSPCVCPLLYCFSNPFVIVFVVSVVVNHQKNGFRLSFHQKVAHWIHSHFYRF